MDKLVSEISVAYNPNTKASIIIKQSTDAYKIFRELISSDTIELKEEALCLYLNRASQVLGWYRISSGGLTGTVVDIRLILGIALKSAASQIVLCHNHPSGNLKASNPDQELTEKLKQSASLMDIKLLDHLIITKDSYLSFADEGLI